MSIVKSFTDVVLLKVTKNFYEIITASCGGDKNSTTGCGVNCGRTCATYTRDDIACILICYENACDCREGYVYDGNIKKCVLPEDCSKYHTMVLCRQQKF